MPTSSYLAQVELPMTFGLGKTMRIETLNVTWPDGSQQTVGEPAADQVLILEQGGHVKFRRIMH